MRRIAALMFSVSLLACGGADESTTGEEADATGGGEGETTVEVIAPTEGAQPPPASGAVANLQPTEGNAVSGTVSFEQTADGVTVTVDLSGLEPGTSHGFHVHETGDCSAPDGTSAGGHFNPGGHDHALPETETRHAGDMGNLEADESGEVHVTRTFTNFSVNAEDPPAVLGRGVIVHAAADDGGQPTGNAGARIACGVIEAP